MRLLQCRDTGEFGLTKDFLDDEAIPPYASDVLIQQIGSLLLLLARWSGGDRRQDKPPITWEVEEKVVEDRAQILSSARVDSLN